MPASPHSGERILLTGGRGFVGRRLHQLIAERRPEWAVFAPPSPTTGGADGLDVTDAEAMARVVADLQPTQVVHLAAVSAVQASQHDPRGAWRTNLFGTMNVVEAVRRAAPACRILFVSSAEVYGRSFERAEPLDETALLQPANPYAISKAAADMLVQQAGWDGAQTCVMRPFNHTGAGQATTFVAPSFAAQIAAIERGEAEPLIEVGQLDDERDFLDVGDVVAAYLLLLEQPVWGGGCVYNVASGRAVRIGDMLDALLSQSTVKERIRIEVRSDRVRKGGVSRVRGDARRLMELGWRPRIDFTSTVGEVLRAARSGGAAHTLR